MPAAHQRPSERTLESSDAGQESLVRPEPRGSVVVVHAEEGAGTGAAGAAGAETHNIHAFVHPREKCRLPWCLLLTAKLREAARVRKREKRKGEIKAFSKGEKKKEEEEGKSFTSSSHTLTGGGEGEEGVREEI